MEVIYKSRHIHSVPELNLETDSWILTLMCLGRVAPNVINCSRPHWLFQDYR